MKCQYCRAQIEVDAHRCDRCGRRTIDRVPVQMTATVPALETLDMPVQPAAPSGPQLVPDPVPGRTSSHSDPAYQAYLFGPMAAPSQTQPAAPEPRKRMPRPPRTASQQSALDFQETLSHASVESSVYCEASVATAVPRIIAASLDTALAMLAMFAFAVTCRLAGMEIATSNVALSLYTGAAALILLFYRLLFCVANVDTPGVQWTGLRVLDFDGRIPTRRQRWYRLLGGLVGVVAAGIGLIWALVDEERLAWHDHMSKTFPTPRFR